MTVSTAIDDESSDGDDPRLPGADADFGFGRRRRSPRQPVPPSDPLVGAIVGDVRLERLLDEGGMGRVYLGRQLRPDRPVAVKVIKPGMCTPAVLRRFERESEALARLRHPGIAQIHSLGTCPVAGAETPYFVMEYVADGRAITDHAAAVGLGTRERLELFRQVCDAVGHAHSRGILHRDLKPGNILVDEDGRSKVIDFGVARHLDRDTILTTGLDDIGRLVGTLPYIAPEVLRGDPGAADTRIDVYSLGVVLYELLAGRPPFDLRRAVLAQAARVVLEDDPPPLSSCSPGSGRDIGRVVRKAMEKEPARRYASVSDLAADIDRFLRGESVLARRSSLHHALRRLWRRHAALLAFGAGLFAFALAIGLAGAVRGLSTAGRKETPAPADGSAVVRRRPQDGVGGRRFETGVPSAADVGPIEPVEGHVWIQAPRLSVAAAEALATKYAYLTVAVREIDAGVARALAAHRYGLSLVGVRELADDVAAELAKARGGVLNIDPVERLSATACASLAGYRGWLNMNGVRPWPEGGLEAIVGHVGGLSLTVDGLSVAQARVLARHEGHLYVLGIKTLGADAARELVRHAGRLDLWRAEGITPDAEAILRQRADVVFPGKPEVLFPYPGE